jgi:hypothetical protein
MITSLQGSTLNLAGKNNKPHNPFKRALAYQVYQAYLNYNSKIPINQVLYDTLSNNGFHSFETLMLQDVYKEMSEEIDGDYESGSNSNNSNTENYDDEFDTANNVYEKKVNVNSLLKPSTSGSNS